MVQDLIKATITLFVILDVIGLIPIYLSFLKDSSKKIINFYARKTVLFSSIILFIFLFLGSQILGFFSISVEDFKIAGGLILLIIGIKFVLGLRVISTKERKNHSFAAVPFATPLLVGPGTITTIIIFVNAYGYLITFLAAVINMFIIYLFLKNSKSVYQLLGHQGSEVVTRIMGLLITAIAIGFIRSGWFS
ncbi:MAG: MarC family protein [Nanoarchaeota archaeon]